MTHDLTALSLAFALALPAFAQAPATPAPAAAATPAAAAPRQTFVLEPNEHSLPVLIDRVAVFLDCNILYNAAELENVGRIRITRRTEVDKQGCWELFGALLYHKGLAIVTLDRERGFHEVIPMQGPRSREIANAAMFVEAAQVEAYANQKATPILTSVPLRNINATVATNALRPFFASNGNVPGIMLGNVGNNSDILVQGYGPQVAAACRMLRLVDVDPNTVAIEMQVVRLQHAQAAELVATLEATLNSRAAHQTAQAAAAGMPVATGAAPMRVVAHPAQNAVILSGTTAQLREALDLCSRLDVPATAQAKVAESLERRLQRLEERLQALEAARAPK